MSPTISRGAFFGGIAAGGAIAVVGFHFIPHLGFPGWASLVGEMVIVAISLAVTSGIWRVSADRGSRSLDTPPDGLDR